jgi:hypothetical protein
MKKRSITLYAVFAVLLVVVCAVVCSKKSKDSTDTANASSDVPAPSVTQEGLAGHGSDGVGPGATCIACEMKGTNQAKPICFHTSKTPDIGTTDPAKFGCDGFPPADQARCKTLLSCLRVNHCAQGDDTVTCLCGPLDRETCISKPIESLPGPCRDQYIAAASGGNVLTLWGSTDSPIGVANNLYSCDLDAPCTCSGM